MSLRDEIAQEIFSHDGEIDDWVETTQEIRDVYLGIADSILPLIRKAVGGIKNPVPIRRTGEYLGFCEGIKAVEKLLEVEYE